MPQSAPPNRPCSSVSGSRMARRIDQNRDRPGVSARAARGASKAGASRAAIIPTSMSAAMIR